MTSPPAPGGRVAQRSRTRRAILHAAARLLARGGRPSLEEIAAEAEVSRATAYRYFPGLEALLSEAAVDALVTETDSLFDSDATQDAAARLALVDETFDRVTRQGEIALRMMLARILERNAQQGPGEPTLRLNRRTPLIERALEPIAGKLPPPVLARLTHSLAMVIGTDGFFALNDVVGLNEEEARDVRRWAIEALLKAALADQAG